MQVEHERLFVGRKSHHREVQLRVDAGDLQPQCTRMSQALDVAGGRSRLAA